MTIKYTMYTQEIQNKMRESIKAFVKSFKGEFGITPICYVTTFGDNEEQKEFQNTRMTILEEFVNKYISQDLVEQNITIRSKCRKNELVALRFIFFHLCEKEHIGVSAIGRYFNMHHSSVIHARTALEDIVNQNYNGARDMYNSIMQTYNEYLDPKKATFEGLPELIEENVSYH